MPERIGAGLLRLKTEVVRLRLDKGLRLRLEHRLLLPERHSSLLRLEGLLGLKGLLCHPESGGVWLDEAGLLRRHHGLSEWVEYLLTELLLLTKWLLHLLREATEYQHVLQAAEKE